MSGDLITVTLPRAQAVGLLALASKGRVFLAVEPTFLGHPRNRDDARRGVTTLRTTLRLTESPAA